MPVAATRCNSVRCACSLVDFPSMSDRPNTPAWSRRRLLMGVGAAGGSGAMYRLGTALGLIPGFASAARPALAPAPKPPHRFDTRRGHLRTDRRIRTRPRRLRVHGTRSIAPRRRPQPHAAPRRQGGRTRQSAGVPVRRRPRSVSERRPRAYSEHARTSARILPRTRRSARRRS